MHEKILRAEAQNETEAYVKQLSQHTRLASCITFAAAAGSRLQLAASVYNIKKCGEQMIQPPPRDGTSDRISASRRNNKFSDSPPSS